MSGEWLLIRGSGVVAFALLTLATAWGLLVSTKLLGRLVKAKSLTWFHESLGIGALLATLLHVGVLSVHDFLDFTWLELLVPGASDWKPVAVAMGTGALYGLVLVSVQRGDQEAFRERGTSFVDRFPKHAASPPIIYGLVDGALRRNDVREAQAWTQRLLRDHAESEYGTDALLSAFASVGRVWVGPLAGVLAESIGWPTFFIVSTVAALPALAMLWWLRAPVRALEVDPATAAASDD